MSSGRDKLVKVWDFADRREEFSLSSHTAYIFGRTISPDNSRIKSCAGDNSIRVWSFEGRALKFTLSGHRDYIPQSA